MLGFLTRRGLNLTHIIMMSYPICTQSGANTTKPAAGFSSEKGHAEGYKKYFCQFTSINSTINISLETLILGIAYLLFFY